MMGKMLSWSENSQKMSHPHFPQSKVEKNLFLCFFLIFSKYTTGKGNWGNLWSHFLSWCAMAMSHLIVLLLFLISFSLQLL